MNKQELDDFCDDILGKQGTEVVLTLHNKLCFLINQEKFFAVRELIEELLLREASITILRSILVTCKGFKDHFLLAHPLNEVLKRLESQIGEIF